MKTWRQWIFILALALAGQARAAGGGAPARYTGTVVDAQGLPVADATVESYQDASAMAVFTARDFDLKDHTTTDSKGAFSITAGGGVTIALVKKEGLASGWKMFAPALGESGDSVVLTAPTVLAGTVVDDEGKPVADAEVWVSMALPASDGAGLNQRALSKLILGQPAHQSFSTRTSADGRFRIANFPADSQAALEVRKAGKSLRARANFGGSLPYTSGQQDIKLTLDAAGGIAGKVTVQGTGQPLSGVKVKWMGSSAGLSGLDSREPALSGADGSFRIADVPPGRAAVSAVFPGEPLPDWVAENVPVVVVAGETKKDVQIQASKGGVAVVTVLSHNDHKPLADVSVAAYTQSGLSTAVTGADGVARMRLRADQWSISTSKAAWNVQAAEIIVVNGETNKMDLELTPGLQITGTIHDPDGKPVAGAMVSISPNFGNSPEIKTDAVGRYEIAWQMFNFGNQSYSLMARSVERNLAVNHPIDDSITNLDLKLEPGVTLVAKIEDNNGKPVHRAMGSVSLMNGNGGYSGSGQSAQSDAQGRMEITAMPQADGYSLNVSAQGYGSGQQQMQAPSAPTNRLEFPPMALPLANLKLAGKVLDADDKPAADVMVQFFGQHQPNGNTQTDRDGRFSFDAVCDGPIQLNANAQGSFANVQTRGGDTNVVMNLGVQNVRVAGASPALKITGTVRDAAGAPAAGVRVTVWGAGFGNNNEVKTDSTGHYTARWQMQNNGGGMQMAPFIIARDLEHNLAVAHDIDDTISNLDLTLQPGLTLAVKVQDVDGKPVPTATETLILWAGNSGSGFNQLPLKADEHGLIEVKGLPQERHYSADITAKGYGSANVQAQPGDTQTTRFEFPSAVLHVADRKLAGQVLGLDGKPVAGANVNIQGQGQPNANTTSDSKGRFAFDAVCEGAVRLFAYNQNGGGSANAQAQGGDTNVVLQFGINGQGMGPNVQRVTTSGTVFDAAGAPVAGARLSVVGGIGGMNTEVKSDADGKYSIAWQFQNVGARGRRGAPAAAPARRGGAAPAIQNLLVARDLTHNLAATVEIDEKSTTVDVHLQTALTLSGSVEDPSGAPVKNAMILLNMMTTRRVSMIGQQPTMVDSQGAFSIKALPPGQQYMVNVTANGYGSINHQVAVAQTQTASLTLPAFRLKLANQKLEGQVVDANDKPVSGANVQISGADQPSENTTTDSKGHFVFNHVCEGPLRVLAYNQNYNGGGIMPQGNIPAQGGDLNVIVKLSVNQGGGGGVAVRQAPPRATSPKEQSWTWTGLRNWPQQHKTAVIVLLCLQVTASLAAAGGIFWFTRKP